MPATKSWGIKGTVTRAGTAVQGAKIWAENLTNPKTNMEPHKDGFTYIRTDSNGRYVLDSANISSSSLANGDTIRVYCQVKDEKIYEELTCTLNTAAGTTQNFALSNTLIDGVRDTPLTDGSGALKHNNTKRGCKDGLN